MRASAAVAHVVAVGVLLRQKGQDPLVGHAGRVRQRQRTAPLGSPAVQRQELVQARGVEEVHPRQVQHQPPVAVEQRVDARPEGGHAHVVQVTGDQGDDAVLRTVVHTQFDLGHARTLSTLHTDHAPITGRDGDTTAPA